MCSVPLDRVELDRIEIVGARYLDEQA